MTSSSYVNTMLPAQLAMLDEVRYFGITVTASGALTTTAADLANINTIKQKISELPESDRPRLDITLGGAGEAASFAAVAQSSSLRTQLAQNINALLNQTEAVGVDIDWEHPAEGAQLTTHYPAMLSTIKQEIGASRRLYATVSPEKMLPRSVFEGANAVDGVSIMTYDIGWWANDPADPNLGQHSLHEYVEDAVEAWTNPAGMSIPRTWVFGSKRSIDAPEAKLGVGSPFYARGYNGTSGDVAVAHRDLTLPWTTADGNAHTRTTPTQNAWLPGPELVADRIAYAEQLGLQHIIFWELWHDLPTTSANSLLRTAFETRAALAGDFNADGQIDAADLSAWGQHLGATANVTGPMGDANNDNRVDGTDFLIWQRKVGMSAPIVPASAAVSEPATMAMLLMGALWATRRRRPRK
jgi:hypothetical protein